MAKIIIDTSVWIDFFKGNLKRDQAEYLEHLIKEDLVGITDIIRYEILVGAKNEKDYLQLFDWLNSLSTYRLLSEHHENLENFAWQLAKKGLIGKYTDVNIAFLCRRYQMPLWSFDQYFFRLKEKKLIHLLSL